jgi:hypothetical protein
LVGILLVVRLPHRVQTIYIGDNYIHLVVRFATKYCPLSLQI